MQLLIYINDGSDGSLDWVKAQNDLEYIHSNENVGICHAMNALAEIATAPWLLYLNDDMYVLHNWDKALYDRLLEIGHNRVMLSGTMIEPIETGNLCVIVADHGRHPSELDTTSLLQAAPQYNKTNWQGATWPPNVIHRELWDSVGGYSTEFSPGYYSDPDLSMKLWQQGVRHFEGVADSRVYHFGKASTSRIASSGKKLFLNKWGISASTFTKHYLKRGQAFTGQLKEPSGVLYGLACLKDKLKSK